jgi:hypothetical protein
MDATYNGRKYWIIVFRSYELKKNLLRKEISWETVEDFKEGIKELQKWWRIIKAIVCDGKRGLLWGFWEIPVQMCIFHQKQIITRYLTRHPKSEEWKELKWIAESIGDCSKENLSLLLDDRYRRHQDFLKEKNYANKPVHNRIIQTYRSIKRNMKYLYTFKDYEWIIDIPRTTWSLESVFGHLKENVRHHRWLKKHRKLKVMRKYLWK